MTAVAAHGTLAPANEELEAMASVKERDLAGPGIGDYAELERILPDDYRPLLEPRETMQALYGAKRLIEDRLARS